MAAVEISSDVVGDDNGSDSVPAQSVDVGRVSVFDRLSTKKDSRLEFTSGEKSNFAKIVGDNPSKTLSFFPPESKAVTCVTIPIELAKQAAKTYHTTLHGYFLGSRMPFQVVHQAVKRAWSKFGFSDLMMNSNGVFFLKFNDEGGCLQVIEQGPIFIRGAPFFVFQWDPSKGLAKPVHSSCPLWVKLHNIPLAAFNVEGIGRIASTLGIPKQLDSATAAMCDKSWGRPGFAKVLIDIWAIGDLKREIDVVVPSLSGEADAKVKVGVEYMWEPVQCNHCMVFGHKKSACPKSVEITASKDKNKVTDNEGFTKVIKKKWVPKARVDEASTSKDHVQQKTTDLECSNRFDTLLEDGEVNVVQESPQAPQPTHVELDEPIAVDVEGVDMHMVVDANLEKDNQKEKQKEVENALEERVRDEGPPRVATVLRTYQADPKPLKGILKNTGRTSEVDKRKLKGVEIGNSGGDLLTKPLGSKFACWNIRGMNSRIKQKEVQDTIRLHSLSLIAVIETRLQSDNIGKVCNDTFGSWNWVSNGNFCQGGTRILIAWNMKMVDLMVMDGHAQAIHCMVRLKNDPLPLYVSIAYGANDLVMRRQMWSSIRKHKVMIGSQPWIVMGDFNAMLFPHDGLGGSSRRDRAMEEFGECVDDVEIMDVRYSGVQYSWRQKPTSVEGIVRKLDRILSNTEFLSRFRSAFAHFHPWGISDHSLGVISFSDDVIVHKPGFKFDNVVTLDPRFLSTVREVWQEQVYGSFMHKVLCRLKKLKTPLRKLRGACGNFSKRVSTIKSELDIVQIACDSEPYNVDLMEDLAHIQLAYQQARLDEEMYFAQRAKIKWLNEGDGNTRYFHNAVKERRGKNYIRSVCDLNGNYTFDNGVEDVFVDHFHTILGTEDGSVCPDLHHDLFENRLNLSEALHMIRPIQDSEIKDAIFSIGNDKAPGSDGFSSKFFKDAWEVIGSDVTIAIHNFFYTARLTKEINHTLLCLIPKVPNATCVSEYRPISCCTVLYKCISKLLSDRMKPYLDKVVSKAQSAFIPGRRISDNILVAHELISGYNHQRGPPRCAFKIDIRKAYDMVSWKYILNLLDEFGFHPAFNKWIAEMIQSPSYSLALNGGSFGFFKGARGIRQGDPISPYLFTLVMEGFSLILKKCIRESHAFRFHANCEELNITHLCFADDLFVFTYGDVDSVRTLKKALELFRHCSGLEASMDKSEVFFGNVPNEVQHQIRNLLPFREGVFPIRYLGVPLSPSRLRSADYGVLIRKVKSRIDNWKNKFLSFGGRKQLISSVLQSLSLYWMSVFILPSGVIHELEAIFRRFLWNQGEDDRGKCRLAWADVCKPIYSGGLGFKRLALWNRALVSKHLWDIITKRESVWVEWLWANAFLGVHLGNQTKTAVAMGSTVHSWITGSNSAFHFFESDGCATYAWSDRWMDVGSLSTLISYRRYQAQGFTKGTLVHDLIVACGNSWPNTWIQMAPMLALHPIPSLQQGVDVLRWSTGPNVLADFSVRLAWQSFEGANPIIPWTKSVGFKGCIPKHSFCLWVACHGRLPTHDRIASWKHDPPDMVCAFCKLIPDSHSHLFFECTFTIEVWRKVKHQVELYGFPKKWVEICAKLSQPRGFRRTEHLLALAATVYHVWRERNNRIFQGRSKPSNQVVNDICDNIIKRMAWRTITHGAVANG
ncbi:LOW QUALITY PROTEIN: hypothetical protein OSB04_un000159 [Centaurea solstitialis]|uniref:Reverse transcriptase domain-containing protein n=1 Tax=Centaurea solstitialis TaxID=347529 RepID=A0AA38SIN3_9ASTR|nr:LOW QUALITY PROTEIN: hypothetical protein OSB04_un000159 [Centaurea solstitialis]